MPDCLPGADETVLVGRKGSEQVHERLADRMGPVAVKGQSGHGL